MDTGVPSGLPINNTSDHSKCTNPRWLPKWLPNSINGHNSGSRVDRVVNSTAKYMFSGVTFSTECIKMTSGHPHGGKYFINAKMGAKI